MKIIDRVIFCLTNNDNYIHFWNYISKVYKLKFNVTPTLCFIGTEEEYTQLTKEKLSSEYGDIIFLKNVDNVQYDPSLNWTCTWGLFYTASLFPDEVCMLSGIDQIPLSGLFFDEIKKINGREKYIIGLSDAYEGQIKNMYGDTVYPSSHHVGLGKFFKNIYNIKDEWEDELMQVWMHRGLCTCGSCWGLDELYSSHMIKKYENTPDNNILHLNIFKYFDDKRISRNKNSYYTGNLDVLNAIKNSEYSEFHAERPFSLNQNMNLLFEHIPTYENIQK